MNMSGSCQPQPTGDVETRTSSWPWGAQHTAGAEGQGPYLAPDPSRYRCWAGTPWPWSRFCPWCSGWCCTEGKEKTLGLGRGWEWPFRRDLQTFQLWSVCVCVCLEGCGGGSLCLQSAFLVREVCYHSEFYTLRMVGAGRLCGTDNLLTAARRTPLEHDVSAHGVPEQSYL